MKTFIKENSWCTRGLTDFGWGNGYVLIPSGHPLHGVSYSDINVDVHGGLTLSNLVTDEMAERFGLPNDFIGGWLVGFDTCHTWDTLEDWPKEKVQEETDKLAAQLSSYSPNIKQQLQAIIDKVISTQDEQYNVSLTQTRLVAVIDDFEDEPESIKYNGWLEDLINLKNSL